MQEPERSNTSLGYEFSTEEQARSSASELDHLFDREELVGLRVYRVRWNGNYLVEATFSPEARESRLSDARALLGEVGAPVHQEDLEDYKRASQEGSSGVPDWLRRLFGPRGG